MSYAGVESDAEYYERHASDMRRLRERRQAERVHRTYERTAEIFETSDRGYIGRHRSAVLRPPWEGYHTTRLKREDKHAIRPGDPTQ